MTTRDRSHLDDRTDSWREFHSRPTAEELSRRQGVKPLRSIGDLAVPELAGEDPDELLALLDELRIATE